MTEPNTPRTNYHLITKGGVAVGWVNPESGAETRAVKCEPPGQPVGSSKPLSPGNPGFWP